MGFNILSFTAGLWLVAYCRAVPSLGGCVAALAAWLLIGGGCWLYWRQSRWLRLLLLNGVFFGLGFTWADNHAGHWLSQRLTPQWVGQDIAVTGRIMTLPTEESQYTRFLLRTEQFAGQLEEKRLQLSWQNPHPPLQVGERWQLMVRLKPPHALANFGALNRLRFFWAQDIHATGYVVSRKNYQQLSASPYYFGIARWRQQLQHEIKQAIRDPTAAAMISALTIGAEGGLTDADWRILQRTGTVHLVVIAGLHIGFMVWIAYFCVSRLWRCVPAGLLRFPAQQAGAVAALIFALGYGALAGFSIPTQRAVIMIVLATVGQLWQREIIAWRRILIAFWLVIIIQPGALFSAGFWLSFAAVAWIDYSVSGEWRRAAQWRQWLRMQWALFLGLTPLTIYFFQQFSVVSMLANLPAIIWIGWVIVPLCLLAGAVSAVSVAAGVGLFKVAAYLLTPLWHFLQGLADWPFAGWQYAFASPWLMWSALIGVAWYLAPSKIPGRWLGLLGFLPACLVQPARPSPGAFWVTLLDVGQGLALTVQTANHLLVYDAGMHVPTGFDAGRDVISPYLVTLGAKKIDLLMISHGDNDHSGGARALLNQWPVLRLSTSVPRLFADYRSEYCVAGQAWQWDGVWFRVLGPPAGRGYEDNNSSCILQMGNAQRRVLFTGDMEAPAEAALVARYGAELRSSILVVPHHGSKTSSTEPFLQQVHPDYALFSIGYFNRFHFPAPLVAQRYRSFAASQWLTAVNGAIRLRVSADSPITIDVANPHHYFWQGD